MLGLSSRRHSILLVLGFAAVAFALLLCVQDDYNPDACPLASNERVEWTKLPSDARSCLRHHGWTRDHWDCGSTDEDFLEWDDLPLPRQAAMEARRWTRDLWNNFDDPCAKPLRHAHLSEYNPTVVKLDVPHLQEMNMERLSHVFHDTKVRVIDGHRTQEVDNYGYVGTQTVSEFIDSAKQGDSRFYMFLESGMPEKQALAAQVGHLIFDDLRTAIATHPVLLEKKIWKSDFQVLQRQDFDWAVFFGAAGTMSPSHYDADVLNFLYLVEGKKRVVVVPNNEHTVGTFHAHVNKGGGFAWLEENILDAPISELPKGSVEIIINAGEGLHIPYLAWHAVQNLEPSLAYSLRILD